MSPTSGKPGRPKLTRGGQTVSFWLGTDELKLMRAWAAYHGHPSLSAALRALVRESRMETSEDDR